MIFTVSRRDHHFDPADFKLSTPIRAAAVTTFRKKAEALIRPRPFRTTDVNRAPIVAEVPLPAREADAHAEFCACPRHGRSCTEPPNRDDAGRNCEKPLIFWTLLTNLPT